MSEELDQELEWDDSGQIFDSSTGPATAVQAVRFGRDELTAIRQAARESGETTADYIRKAAMARAGREGRSTSGAVA